MKRPNSLNFVAGLFFAGGLSLVWDCFSVLCHLPSDVGIGLRIWIAFVALLPVAFFVGMGFGLIRLRAGCRYVVLVLCWFAFVIMALILVGVFVSPHAVQVNIGPFQTTADRNPMLAVVGLALMFGFTFWVYRVLTRADIRSLFISGASTSAARLSS